MNFIIDYSTSLSKIRTELKNYLVENNLKSLIIGISGGIDSALVVAIAKPICDELGVNLIGRSITIKSNKPDEIERARKIGNNFCHDFKEIDLTHKYEELSLLDDYDIAPEVENGMEYIEHKVSTECKIRMGNIKARLRMIYLYNLASKNHGLVLSTDNYTEYLLGFWTLHGDVGDYSMIQYLWKTEVYEMSEYIINNELKTAEEKEALKLCVDATATDGLGITNSDLDQILPSWEGSSRDGYKKVDEILIDHMDYLRWYGTPGEKEFPDRNNPVIIRNKKSEFKRNNPTMLSREQIT